MIDCLSHDMNNILLNMILRKYFIWWFILVQWRYRFCKSQVCTPMCMFVHISFNYMCVNKTESGKHLHMKTIKMTTNHSDQEEICLRNSQLNASNYKLKSGKTNSIPICFITQFRKINDSASTCLRPSLRIDINCY